MLKLFLLFGAALRLLLVLLRTLILVLVQHMMEMNWLALQSAYVVNDRQGFAERLHYTSQKKQQKYIARHILPLFLQMPKKRQQSNK